MLYSRDACSLDDQWGNPMSGSVTALPLDNAGALFLCGLWAPIGPGSIGGPHGGARLSLSLCLAPPPALSLSRSLGLSHRSDARDERVGPGSIGGPHLYSGGTLKSSAPSAPPSLRAAAPGVGVSYERGTPVQLHRETTGVPRS